MFRRKKDKGIILKIYFKNKKKPIILFLDNVDWYKKFYVLLSSEDIYIKFGNFIFDKREFRCATLEEK